MVYRKKNIVIRILRKMFFYLYNYSKNITSFILYLLIKSKVGQPKKTANKIVLINTLFLGDVTLCLDFIWSLIQSGKYSEVYYVVRNDYVDYISSLNDKIKIIGVDLGKYRFNFAYRINFIKSLQAEGFTYSINLSPERGFVNDEITLLVARSMITLHDKSKYLFNPFLKILNSHYDKIFSKSVINEYSKLDDLLNELGIIKYFQEINKPKIFTALNNLPQKYVVIAPLSNDFERGISLDRYLKLAKHIAQSSCVVILGSKKQMKDLDIFQGDNIINLCGMLHMREIPQLINNCLFYIGNDSGITHIAIKYKKMLIAIIGGGMYGRFFPSPYKRINQFYFYNKMDCFNCYWDCHYLKRYCLIGIDDERIIEKIDYLISLHL